MDVYCNSTTYTGIVTLSSGDLDTPTIKSDCGSTSYALFNGTTSGSVLTLTSNVTAGQIATGQVLVSLPGATTIGAFVTITSLASGGGQTSGSTWNLSNTPTAIASSTQMETTAIHVPKFYDQATSGSVSTATPANSAYLVIGFTSTGKSCMYFDIGVPDVWATNETITSTNVKSLSAVSDRDPSDTNVRQMIGVGSNNQLNFANSANTAWITGQTNSIAGPTATDAIMHAFNGVLGTGTSAILNVDGTDGSGGNAGAGSAATTVSIASNNSGGQNISGFQCEALGWANASTSGNRTSEHTNQSAYYGTP